jgi:hypothetical protein
MEDSENGRNGEMQERNRTVVYLPREKVERTSMDVNFRKFMDVEKRNREFGIRKGRLEGRGLRTNGSDERVRTCWATACKTIGTIHHGGSRASPAHGLL